jgi:UDP-N-acetyl-D-glucosamine dehydrogenase
MNLKYYKKKLRDKILNKKLVIGVIGLGYVGLPLSILFAKKKFKILGFDTNKEKIRLLNSGRSYIDRIADKDIKILNRKGEFFNNFKNINKCNVLIICVPTPLKSNNNPDLSYIKKTISSIKEKLEKGQVLILESTSYPGTTREEIVKKLNKKFLPGKNFFIGFSSERINPGFNENTIFKVPKVVSGYSSDCLEIISSFYKLAFKEVIKSKSLEIAEFSKLLENIYRAVNIGFINEMKFVADIMKLDIYEVLKVASTKPFGFRPFAPGPGVGGHCIPIDPHYLYWSAKRKGVRANFIKLSAETNISVINFIKKIDIQYSFREKNKKKSSKF